MVIDNALLTNFLTVRAHIVASRKVLHHTFLFRVIYMLLAIVAEEVALRLCLNRTNGAFVITFFRVSILHVLKIVASRSKTFVAFNANKTLLFVLINNVHAHCRWFFVVAVETADRTINVCSYLFITFDILGIARSRGF